MFGYLKFLCKSYQAESEIRALVSAVGGEAVSVTASQYSAYPACSGGKKSIWKVGVTKTA